MRKLKNTELNRKSIEEFKKADKTPAIVVLDNIRSIHNVGSIFRSSDSFLIKKLYICGITATPENLRMEKTALGSTDSVDWEYIKEPEDLIQKLKKDNIIITAVEQADKSIKIQDFHPVTGSIYGFVFGNEVEGVREEFIKASKHVIEIPQVGTKHSLNVSVAAGIVLWDFYQKKSDCSS